MTSITVIHQSAKKAVEDFKKRHWKKIYITTAGIREKYIAIGDYRDLPSYIKWEELSYSELQDMV